MYESSYGYLCVLLVALLAVKYQALNKDPFHEHATIMLLFLTAIFTHLIAFTGLKLPTQNNRPSPILRFIAHVSGIVANELLVLMLVNPLYCFIINLSAIIINVVAILLAQVVFYCYQYVSPICFEVQHQSAEYADVLMEDLGADWEL